jgi:hypothetical protein
VRGRGWALFFLSTLFSPHLHNLDFPNLISLFALHIRHLAGASAMRMAIKLGRASLAIEVDGGYTHRQDSPVLVVGERSVKLKLFCLAKRGLLRVYVYARGQMR